MTSSSSPGVIWPVARAKVSSGTASRRNSATSSMSEMRGTT